MSHGSNVGGGQGHGDRRPLAVAPWEEYNISLPKHFEPTDLPRPVFPWCAQTINDWYDREIDAINEPYRPIPSGAISEVSLRFGMRWVVGVHAMCCHAMFPTTMFLRSTALLYAQAIRTC